MITLKRRQRIKKVVSQRQKDIIIIFEDIYDPHNAAAVLRTCDAFGIQEIHFIFEKQKPFNPRRIGKQSSATANKWLDFHRFDSTKKCLNELKMKGFAITATVLDKDAEKLHEVKFKYDKIALLFGNERTGLSDIAIQMADKKIYIPMRGFVQSLNLSVTTAICIYEITRQRRKIKNKNFQLNKKQKKKLYEKFIKK